MYKCSDNSGSGFFPISATMFLVIAHVVFFLLAAWFCTPLPKFWIGFLWILFTMTPACSLRQGEKLYNTASSRSLSHRTRRNACKRVASHYPPLSCNVRELFLSSNCLIQCCCLRVLPFLRLMVLIRSIDLGSNSIGRPARGPSRPWTPRLLVSLSCR
jgi:hypothetical protein